MGLAEQWRPLEIECDGIDANEATTNGTGSFDFPIRLTAAPTEPWVRIFRSIMERYEFMFTVGAGAGDDRLWVRGVAGVESRIIAAYTDVARVVSETNPEFNRKSRQVYEQFRPVIDAAKRIDDDLNRKLGDSL